jgi:hypothetical protein
MAYRGPVTVAPEGAEQVLSPDFLKTVPKELPKVVTNARTGFKEVAPSLDPRIRAIAPPAPTGTGRQAFRPPGLDGWEIPLDIPGQPATDARGNPFPKYVAKYSSEGDFLEVTTADKYFVTAGQGDKDKYVIPKIDLNGRLISMGSGTPEQQKKSIFRVLADTALEAAPYYLAALTGANLLGGSSIFGGAAGAGAGGAGAAGAASSGTGLSLGSGGVTGLTAGGGSLGLTAASPGAAAIGGSLGTTLAGISTGIGAGAAAGGLGAGSGAAGGVGSMPPVDYGLGSVTPLPSPSLAGSTMSPVDYSIGNNPTSLPGVPSAADRMMGSPGGPGGVTLPPSGAGSGFPTDFDGLLKFAKENPSLVGGAIGAVTGAIDAANAPKEQTTTTSIDPDIKREYMANLDRAKAAAAGLGVRQFAGFTDDYGLAETQLKNLGLGGKGQQTTDEAARLAMIEAGFTPQQIAAAQADRGAVQDVTGQLGSQYMSAYFNPYEEQVVQGTLGDIERSRQMQDIADRARATQARAFGGSRQGVQSALTNEAALRQAGTTAAGLRQAGFSQAAQFGQSDAARQLQAQMANQGVSLTLEQANAQLRQQAALANQQAGISGAGLRQSAISQLGQLGAQQQNLGMSGANAVMLAQMERQKLDQQRLDAQRNLELERLGITSGALGLQPARTGETSTQPLYSSGIGSALSGGLTGAYIGSLLQPQQQPVPRG